MAATPPSYRWTLEQVLRLLDAGVFTKKVELLDGELWSVPIGHWHGTTAAQLGRMLPDAQVELHTTSLATNESLPLPDCWVLRAGARPLVDLSARMVRWAPEDVLLVVEISDETRDYDLGRKSFLYAEAGYTCYWSVTSDGVFEHSRPYAPGYGLRQLYLRGEEIPLPYADGVALDVSTLIGLPD